MGDCGLLPESRPLPAAQQASGGSAVTEVGWGRITPEALLRGESPWAHVAQPSALLPL